MQIYLKVIKKNSFLPIQMKNKKIKNSHKYNKQIMKLIISQKKTRDWKKKMNYNKTSKNYQFQVLLILKRIKFVQLIN